MDFVQDSKGRRVDTIELLSRAEIEAADALALAKASNLSDLANAATARTNLGLGTAATQPSTAFDAAGAAAAAQAASQPLDADLTTIAGLTPTTDNVIQSVAGSWASRTMAQLKTALSLTKSDVGLDQATNTSDANKPVSTAQQAALDLKRNIADKWRADILLSHTPNVLSSGTWTNSGPSGFCSAGSSSAAYSVTWYTEISPGTWSVYVYLTKGSNEGNFAVEYSLDGGANWSTISASVDLYAAAATAVIVSATGISIAAAGRFDLRLRSLGTKNALSSNYFCVSNNAALVRTA